MQILIAIDDTDNLTSRGTGHVARELSRCLSEKGLINPFIIIRHQLLVSEQIPYTSHNSSASIRGELTGNLDELKSEAEKFLIENAAPGSDVGLCVLPIENNVNYNPIIDWGKRAKKEVLKREEAHQLAEKHNIFLKGLTGEKIGIIGTLAAIGLNLWGNDGRVLWMKGIREANGITTANDFVKEFHIDSVLTTEYKNIPENSTILLGEWTRPIMYNNQITLFVESVNSKEYEFQTASKSFIKSLSE